MQLPVYVQDGADRGEPLLLYVLLGTLVVVHLWNTYLDWRQHRMYHPSVRIPDALEAALKAVDAQAKDHDQRNGSGEGEEGKEHGDDDARKAADKDGDESDEEEIEVGKLWPTTVDKFVKSQAYGRAKSSFGFFQSTVSLLIEIAAYLSGLYPLVWDNATVWAAAWGFPSSPTASSLLFCLQLMLFETVVSLPFSLFSTFVVEERFGFNKTTVGTFVSDLLKSLVLSCVIGGPVIVVVMHLARRVWLLWPVAFAIQLFLLLLWPAVIAPMFNKFDTLPRGPLRTRIEDLASQLEFPLRKLFVTDGSRRSNHSNAYFTGLTWCRNVRIVLYDTLLKQATESEIVAILAHELGHWRLNHVFKQLAVAQLQLIIQFVLYSAFADATVMFRAFGFVDTPEIVGIMLFFQLAFTPLSPVLGFLMSAMSRRYEFQADRFAVELGMGGPLSSGLVKISLKNLGALAVDPLYSTAHYSHPPLVERLYTVSRTSFYPQNK